MKHPTFNGTHKQSLVQFFCIGCDRYKYKEQISSKAISDKISAVQGKKSNNIFNG